MQVAVELELDDRPHDLRRERRVRRRYQIAQVRPHVLRVRGNADVLEHRRIFEQLERLERTSNADAGTFGRRHTRDVLAVQRHPTFRRCEAAHGVNQRRLAGAVRADQPRDGARSEVEADIVDRYDGPVAHRHVLDAQYASRNP